MFSKCKSQNKFHFLRVLLILLMWFYKKLRLDFQSCRLNKKKKNLSCIDVKLAGLVVNKIYASCASLTSSTRIFHVRKKNDIKAKNLHV